MEIPCLNKVTLTYFNVWSGTNSVISSLSHCELFLSYPELFKKFLTYFRNMGCDVRTLPGLIGLNSIRGSLESRSDLISILMYFII